MLEVYISENWGLWTTSNIQVLCRQMEQIFLLLLLVSGSLSTGNYSYLGTGTSLAVCQSDTCALLSVVAAVREKAGSPDTRHTARFSETSAPWCKKNLPPQKLTCSPERARPKELWKINQVQDEQLKTESLALLQLATPYNTNNSGLPNSVVWCQRVISIWDTMGNNSHDSATNAAVVQLEAGHCVCEQQLLL